MTDDLKRKLKGGLKGAASWVSIKEDGSLEVETFDYSDGANSSFGNDVAFMVTVDPEHFPALLERLEWKGEYPGEVGLAGLLEAVQQRFSNYFDFKDWLGKQGIPFSTQFDSRA
jgi:hypothetical protein